MAGVDLASEEIVRRLGGDAALGEIGGAISADDPGHFDLRFRHPSPRGVRSVVITVEPNGLFGMTCYGPLRAGAFQAERLGKATGILPENLATVLGQLTGIETLHHRHY